MPKPQKPLPMLPNKLALPRPKRRLTPVTPRELTSVERRKQELSIEIEWVDELSGPRLDAHVSDVSALLVRCVLLRIAAYRAAGVDLRAWTPSRLVQDEIRIVGVSEPEVLSYHYDAIGRALARAVAKAPVTGHRACPGCDSQTCEHIPECTLHPSEYSE